MMVLLVSVVSLPPLSLLISFSEDVVCVFIINSSIVVLKKQINICYFSFSALSVKSILVKTSKILNNRVNFHLINKQLFICSLSSTYSINDEYKMNYFSQREEIYSPPSFLINLNYTFKRFIYFYFSQLKHLIFAYLTSSIISKQVLLAKDTKNIKQ